MLLSQFFPPAPSPLCSQVCCLSLRLHCCPAKRFIRTIFLDSTYTLKETITEKDTGTPVFIATLFTMARTWKKSPLIETLRVVSVT